eukprot:TRINITY_DN37913_c0_g1_i1.p1 TRINITY_DN37913_c0_g1~~TRINITY_DN37913_c0_g1_i1.p1  ORF type:complete len:387 (+),score=66.64 TRINITY_DN37913_c0_g1_i1:59-1219(+)
MRSQPDFRFLLGFSAGVSVGWLLPRLIETVRKLNFRCLRSRGADANDVSASGQPGPIYLSLCTHLHGTPRSPFQDIPAHQLPAQDHSYAHTNLPLPFLHALLERLQAKFLIEIGSFKGGSALRIAEAAVASGAASMPCLLCIDTFLGDAGMWLDHNPGWRDWLMLQHGHPNLYWQFMANVESMRDVILPLPLASTCALRALHRLAVRNDITLTEFIYLDSAHEKGETLLEITQAFQLLKAGGVLLGDDLDWPAVESDLHVFISQLGHDATTGADDEMLQGTAGLLFCPTPAPGYWVVDSHPRQWLLRKAPNRTDEEQLDSLRAFLGKEENGEIPTEYVPLTDADHQAVKLYNEAVECSEDGRMNEAIVLFKQAAERSPSLAFHYKL